MERAFSGTSDVVDPIGAARSVHEASFNLGLMVGSDAAFRTALRLAVAMPAYAEQVLNDIDAYTDCVKASLRCHNVPFNQFEDAVKNWNAQEEYAAFLMPPRPDILFRVLRKLVGG